MDKLFLPLRLDVYVTVWLDKGLKCAMNLLSGASVDRHLKHKMG